MKIGVLALQGDFAAHGRMLEKLGVEWKEVKRSEQLNEIDGLIIPGGESSTMLKLLREEGMIEPLKDFARRGRPVYGTCAGAILLAREVSNPKQESLGLVDISIERNAYGRQVDSFTEEAECPSLGKQPLEMVFIRAPIVRSVGPRVKVLARCKGDPVLLREGSTIISTFHPELTSDTRVHKLFVDTVEQSQKSNA